MSVIESKISLGSYISGKRKSMNLTQEQLGEMIHVSKSAIAKWETNGGIPDRDNLYRLAEVFSVSVNDLYIIIDCSKTQEIDAQINITADVISILELYGYKVIRPKEEN